MPENHENLIPQDGEVYLYNSFFNAEESSYFMNKLLEEIEWKQEPIRIMGKEIMQPRLTAWYGDPNKPYSYSGIKMLAHPWTDPLEQIKKRIEFKFGLEFSSVLLNLYRNERDGMGWHRDNEKELGPDPTIISLSFGQSRVFQFRRYKEKSKPILLELHTGSLLIMKGATNHYWEHRIPKTSQHLQPRINLTFRNIIL